MPCARCQQRDKDWEGDDPKCAFESSTFSPDNWNCATMNALRDAAYVRAYSDDQHAALIPFGYEFVVLGWYKNRRRIEFAGVLSELTMLPLFVTVAEEALAAISISPGDSA